MPTPGDPTPPSSALEGLRLARLRLEEQPAEALELAGGLLEGDQAAAAMLVCALAEYRLGNLKAAKGHALAARERLCPKSAEYLEAVLLLGWVLRDLSELEGAERHLAEALELSQDRLDAPVEIKALNALAGLHGMRGEFRLTKQYLRQALERLEVHHHPAEKAKVLSNLGIAHIKLGEYATALEHLLEAHFIAQSHGLGIRQELNCLNNIAVVYEETHEYDKALEKYLQIKARSQAQHNTALETIATLNAGLTYLKLSQLEAAEKHLTEGVILAQTTGSRGEEAVGLEGVGRVRLAQGDHPEARQYFEQAYAIALEISDGEQQPQLQLRLSEAHLALQNPQAALDFAGQALAGFGRLGQGRGLAQAHVLLADAQERAGDLAAALLHLREARRLEAELLNEENERRTRSLNHRFELEQVRREELQLNQAEMVMRLALAAEYRDDNTGEHIQRVGNTSARIAAQLGWPKAKAELLRQAATLHDIGKIAISDLILLKPGKLTPEEYELIKTHAHTGAEMLSGGRSELLRMAEEIARTHHERWDGRGYPAGLSGEAIPEAGRIVAVADVLDALTSERPYKPAWTLEQALAEIRSGAGTQFDPRVVEACMRALGKP